MKKIDQGGQPSPWPESNNHQRILEYLEQYRNNITGIHQGWYVYLYRMVDELLQNGLQPEDKIHAKEKYATCRCHIIAANKQRQEKFDQIIQVYTGIMEQTCQYCNSHGIKQYIDGWEYVLCLEHYLEIRHNISDEYVKDYKDYFKEPAPPEAYAHAGNNDYYRMEEQLFRMQAGLLKHLLLKHTTAGREQVCRILNEYFEANRGSILFETDSFSFDYRFHNEDKIVVKPAAEYYLPWEHSYRKILDELCNEG